MALQCAPDLGNLLICRLGRLGELLRAGVEQLADGAAIAETERRRLGIGKKDLKELAETTRRRGLARVEGDLLPGVSALAAAVLDYRGELAAAIGVIGRTADFDGDWTGAIATDLTAAAQDLSHSLGYSPADKRP